MKTFRIRGDHLILKEEEGCGTFFEKLCFLSLNILKINLHGQIKIIFKGKGVTQDDIFSDQKWKFRPQK